MSISPDRLARFSLYQQHIRYLEIHSDPEMTYKWLNLDVLQQYAPLTPNLIGLSMRRRGNVQSSQELMEMFNLLCSPRCQNFCVVPVDHSETDMPWMSFPDTLDVIKGIVDKQCEPCELELFTKESSPFSSVKDFDLFCSHLGRFTQLRSLGLGGDVICQTTFEIIGSLPHLKRLTISCHPLSKTTYANIHLAGQPFKHLERLAVLNVEAEGLRQLLDGGRMLTGLLSAEFKLTASDGMLEAIPVTIQLIGQYAKWLQVFSYSLPRGAQPSGLPADLLQPLIDLPLRHLEVAGCFLHGVNDFAWIHSLWPDLEVLLMRHQRASTSDLYQFAGRTALLRLAVALRGEPAPQQGLITAPRSKNCIRLEGEFHLQDLELDQVDNYARHAL